MNTPCTQHPEPYTPPTTQTYSSQPENAIDILVIHQPASAELEAMGVFNWPIWEKEVSEFPWTYDESETCYLLAGKVVITTEHGAPVEIGQGDLVTFPAGLSCLWQVKEPVRKHYRFG